MINKKKVLFYVYNLSIIILLYLFILNLSNYRIIINCIENKNIIISAIEKKLLEPSLPASGFNTTCEELKKEGYLAEIPICNSKGTYSIYLLPYEKNGDPIIKCSEHGIVNELLKYKDPNLHPDSKTYPDWLEKDD